MFNLLTSIPPTDKEEIVHNLLSAGSVRIERILSKGHQSPDGFWYDQLENEWVVLLQGAARLNIKGEIHELKKGDSVNLPKHCRHRIEWTTPQEVTIWLAVFYD